MQLRRLIASGLLLAVLLAPALGLALCNTAAGGAMSSGVPQCSRCAEMSHATGASTARQHGPASQLPVAPCCQRKASLPAPGESSAVIVAPLQIALLPSVSPVAALAALPVVRVESRVSSPPLASPLSLLCTLLI
jgi:hypothetical protein